jgi:hypothetical protein
MTTKIDKGSLPVKESRKMKDKEPKTKQHFLIQCSEDADGFINIPIQLGVFLDKKQARKAMIDQASKDLIRGKYYFYRLEEHKFVTHEIYPTPSKSK